MASCHRENAARACTEDSIWASLSSENMGRFRSVDGTLRDRAEGSRARAYALCGRISSTRVLDRTSCRPSGSIAVKFCTGGLFVIVFGIAEWTLTGTDADADADDDDDATTAACWMGGGGGGGCMSAAAEGCVGNGVGGVVECFAGGRLTTMVDVGCVELEDEPADGTRGGGRW